MEISLDSLGCKLNQAEIELIARQFVGVGYQLVASPAEADIYVLNTCTVTHVADRKSRHLLRRAHCLNPGALIVATGCYAERAPEELSRIDGVGLVVGNSEKPRLRQRVEESGLLGGKVAGPRDLAAGYQGRRTRAFVKVQDGCDNFCAYCIVPLVRGRETSLPPDEVVSQVRERVTEGYREVVLTGVRTGSYAHDGTDLSGLLKRILAETTIERLRLSSLQPREISPELVGLFAGGRMCPHFHLCLQSGNDSVLRRMQRGYSTADYEKAVSLIREAVPDVTLTTDVMVGFPGETGTEFEASLDFCRKLEFARLHVFAYSRRDGTAGARLSPQVGDKVKKERSRRMLELAGESARHFQRRFRGRVLPVLFERRSGGGWAGLTANYIKVYTKCGAELTNRFVTVKLVGDYRDGMWGEIETL